MSKIAKIANRIIEEKQVDNFIEMYKSMNYEALCDNYGISLSSLHKLAKSLNISKSQPELTKTTTRNGYHPQAKMLRLIEMLAMITANPMTTEEVGKFLECSKRTAYRYLHLYVDAGFDIQKDEKGRYFNNMSITTKIIEVPEKWERVEGTNYAVSNKGRIKYTGKNTSNTHTDRILKPQNNKGFLFVSLTSGDTPLLIGVGKLVAKFFVANPYNFSKIGFHDGNTLNCSSENLFWKKSSIDFSSYESSYLDLAIENRIPIKEIAKELEVKPKDIVDILSKTFRATPKREKPRRAYIVSEMLAEGKSKREIAEAIGLSLSSVDYYISTYKIKDLDKIDKQKIIFLFESGKARIEIAREMSISVYSVHNCLKNYESKKTKKREN